MEDNNLKTRKVKGSMEFKPDDALVFTPYGKGEPMYEYIKGDKSGRNSALMRTLGEKRQTLVARLRVPADATDPAADLRDELEKVLKGLPASRKARAPKGRVMLDDNYALVRHNERAGRIEMAVTIDLHEIIDFIDKFNKICVEINKCLHFNSDSLRKQCIALATASTK